MTYRLVIPGRLDIAQLADLVAVSEAYSAERERSMEGASTFRDGRVYHSGAPQMVARVSYNGKVWAPEEGGALLFNPYA